MKLAVIPELIGALGRVEILRPLVLCLLLLLILICLGGIFAVFGAWNRKVERSKAIALGEM